MTDQVRKAPPYKTLLLVSLVLSAITIVMAVITGGDITWLALAMLFVLFSFIMFTKLPKKGGVLSKPLFIVFTILGVLALIAVLGLMMPESFIYTAFFIGGCVILGLLVHLIYNLMNKSPKISMIGGWVMAILMAGAFIIILFGGDILSTSVNLEVQRKLEPKVMSVEGGSAEVGALNLEAFRDRELVLSPGDVEAGVDDTSGIEVGYEVTIGTVSDSEGNIYPSPNSEVVTVTSVDSAAKLFTWSADDALENYHLTGEYIIKSRTNILGIIGIIITLLVIVAGKVKLPEAIKNGFGWLLGFGWLALFVYLAVTFLTQGGYWATVLGIAALLAPAIAIFIWLRDRAAIKKLMGA